MPVWVCPVKYGVADGTNALILALRAAGIGPGDQVILPSHTYIATAAAVHYAGAEPVLAECGPDHMLDPEDIEHRITYPFQPWAVLGKSDRQKTGCSGI